MKTSSVNKGLNLNFDTREKLKVKKKYQKVEPILSFDYNQASLFVLQMEKIKKYFSSKSEFLRENQRIGIAIP